jgi:endonuclease YncB( thermonuclease family)
MKNTSLAIVFTSLLTACLPLGSTDTVTVDSVIDALTFTTTNGQTIRMIGLRSPVLTSPVECYGKEALQAAESLIGKEVRLETEPLFTVASDGALPRYVFLAVDTKRTETTGTGANAVETEVVDTKDIMVNERALEMGTSFPLVSEEMVYGSRMLSATKYAAATKKGLWGACTVTPIETPQGTILRTQPLSECLIKGKVLEDGTKIYRTPDCPAYKETIPSSVDGGQWFCAIDTAEDAGFTKATDCQ